MRKLCEVPADEIGIPFARWRANWLNDLFDNPRAGLSIGRSNILPSTAAQYPANVPVWDGSCRGVGEWQGFRPGESQRRYGRSEPKPKAPVKPRATVPPGLFE